MPRSAESPKALLLLPVVLAKSAWAPTAVLAVPVVDWAAPAPMAVLKKPVDEWSALYPTAVFWEPDWLRTRLSPPTATLVTSPPLWWVWSLRAAVIAILVRRSPPRRPPRPLPAADQPAPAPTP